MRYKQVAQLAFVTGVIGLGIVGLIYGDFADVWQGVSASVPGSD